MVRYYDPETTSEEDVRPRARTKSPAERQALMRQRNAALEGQAAFEAAREVALRQLDVRARSRSELETAITSRGFSSEVAGSVIERLTQLGLVDDLAFARAFSRGRFEAGEKRVLHFALIFIGKGSRRRLSILCSQKSVPMKNLSVL